MAATLEQQPGQAGRLAGRRALVTGAAGGQGAAVARRFVAEGASVALSDRKPEELEVLVAELRQSSSSAVSVPADVREESQVRAAVEDAAEALGGIDILYNNAAVLLEADAPVHALERHVWDEAFLVNATGVYLFCRYAVPHLLRANAGVVLNVASVAATAGDATCHAYSASKSALIGLTASIAQRYGADGLRAILICPGFVATPMIASVLSDPRLSSHVMERTALRRIGEPDEVASVAAFLASPDASFITSTIISVHGGLVK